MDYPLSEIIDRLSILMLKGERLSANPAITDELIRFRAAMHSYQEPRAATWLIDQHQINGRIWDLEAEIGRLALQIRALNAERIRHKNEIAAAMGESAEVKVEHASS